MLNKGFVKVFAVALTAVCLFYLSFSFVSRHYDNKAERYANGDIALKNHYLDSLSMEKVYFGIFTLKEVREREIGLGLDLKGGMNVILEIDAASVIRELANTDDQQFNTALNQTISESRKGSSSDFISLFRKKYEAIDSNAKLANIFSVTMRDRVSLDASNDKVIDELRAELNSVADNSFNVLRTRIDRFGVVSPNIQKLDRAERILIELPGVKEPDRVRKLLQGSANLEFWKTYKVSQLSRSFNELNSKTLEVVAAQLSDSTFHEDQSADRVITKSFVDYFQAPYFAMSGVESAVVGVVSKNDTAMVNYMLYRYKDFFPSDAKFKWNFKSQDEREIYYELFALRGDGSKRGPALTGDVVTNARADKSQQGNSWEVSMRMNSTGASRWATITGAEIGNAIAIVLDDYVYSAPNVNSKIEGGNSSISGSFSAEQAKDLENVLKSGKMKAGVRIVQEDVVGPSLGDEAIRAGITSFIIALILLMIYMCVIYGFIPGMIANAALLVNMFFTMGALASFHAVLTLPGIAGLVLTLGMAVDANVLIYERTKEEMNAGKGLRKAIEDGYKNAFSAIFDSYLTTIITGIVLAYFGTGPIRGFATTLIIGLLSSFFTAVYLTRLVYEGAFAKGKLQNLTFRTSMSKYVIPNSVYDFIGSRKKAYIASGLIIVIGITSLFTLGLNKGIDFTGGRNYVIRFDEPIKTAEIQDILTDEFGEQVRVITIGASNQIRVSTNFKIEEESEKVEVEIMSMLDKGLKPYLNGKSIEDAIQSSQTVGGSIADDIKTAALWAVIIAIICMGIYIFARFSDIAFSVGTIAAVTHDTLIIVSLYSILYKFIPISLEIDQTFVAAILTVVGYSVNDKVVVFDRIREFHKLYPKKDTGLLFNEALNSTLTRTVNTSVSTLIVILCIFILGGDTIRSFTFAMMMGVIIGTYSSWFIATPIAYGMIKKQKNEKAVETVK